MVAKYRSVLSAPGCARVFVTALIGRLPQGMSTLAILLLVRAHTHSYAAAGVAMFAALRPLLHLVGFNRAFRNPAVAELSL